MKNQPEETAQDENRKDCLLPPDLLDDLFCQAANYARFQLRLDKAEFLEQAESMFEFVLEEERESAVEDNLDLLAQKLVKVADFARRTIDIDMSVSVFMEEAGAAFAYSQNHPLS